MSEVRRVAAIHDMSGFGKASLTVVIPILGSMGIQACPLPTAILSTHTGIEGFTFLDLTEEMEKIINHWTVLGLSFDAIYSGFLGSPRQVEIVSNFIDDFRSEEQIVLIDPVMADDGTLYSTMNGEMVIQMIRLVEKATIITPNLTELAFLVGATYDEMMPLNEIKQRMRELSSRGPEYIAVTSVPVQETGRLSVIGYELKSNRFWRVQNDKLPVYYPGTGDMFASVLLGNMMKGENFVVSLNRAVHFVSDAIHWSFGFDHDRLEGAIIEGLLHTLSLPLPSYTFELLE